MQLVRKNYLRHSLIRLEFALPATSSGCGILLRSGFLVPGNRGSFKKRFLKF
jgi:hypothetical protein